MNTELGLPALNMLRSHFNQFYKTDEILPPIIFANIVDTKNATVTLWVIFFFNICERIS